jgi:hypothetical protein
MKLTVFQDLVVIDHKKNDTSLLPFEPRACAGFDDAGFNKLPSIWIAKILEYHKNDIEAPDHVSEEHVDNWKYRLVTGWVDRKYVEWCARLRGNEVITFLDKEIRLSQACLADIQKLDREFCQTASDTIWPWIEQEASACKVRRLAWSRRVCIDQLYRVIFSPVAGPSIRSSKRSVPLMCRMG